MQSFHKQTGEIKTDPPQVGSILKIGIYFWVLTLAWSAAVGGSLLWHLDQTNKLVLEAARIQARTAFEKDVLYRRWNNQRGGVYAKTSGITPPNAYLDVPDRNVSTLAGVKLTKINPAYMTRQVHELGTLSTGVLGHITSLKPIRPENRPDPWEKQALKDFERGANEVSHRQELGGVEYLRLMKPLLVEQGCLACHAKQGYQLGDIRGGISVSVPLEPMYAGAKRARFLLLITHLVLWSFGVGGLIYWFHLLNTRLRERHQMALELHRLATTDPLTRIFNRGHLMERGSEEFQRAKRYKTPLSVLMIDVDHFKEVNDIYGHQVGDEVLKSLAVKCSDNIRQTDVFGRYGGEEFMAILTHTDGQGAVVAADNLREALGKIITNTDKGPVQFTVSVGVAEIGTTDQSLEETIKRADRALYVAKERGRNQVVLESKN